MINEEDHLRIQAIEPGGNLEKAAEEAFQAEEILEKKCPFSFDPKFGYLTSCPTNTGTGMRASLMLHLPMLTKFKQMGNVSQNVAKLGLTIRGIYGEGSEARGHLYQLSNQATLGRSEEDVVRSLAAATEQVVGHERAMRENAEKKDMLQLQDTLLRSWGETMHARLMSTKEFMKRYSDIRYAASMGYLHLPIPALDLLMMDLQPGSLGVRAGHLMGEREAEILRAKVLREELELLGFEE
jgi:protein arginine kinase